MTDQPNPGTKPEETAASAAPSEPRGRDDELTTTYAPSEQAVPTANVLSGAALGAPGASVAGSRAGRRSTGIRWAIALGGVAVVIAATAVILVLAGGRPSTSIALGYMPNDTVQYAEYRLDLPGDQRQKVAAFMSRFPGFDDQAVIQPKLYELFDRIVAAVSHDQQTFSADIEPWFGGQIAMGSGAMTPEALLGAGGGAGALSPVAGLGPNNLVVVSVKDSAKATAWIKKVAGTGLSETSYGGTTIYNSGGSFVAVTDNAMLFGNDTSVRAAIDSKGQGKLGDDAEFKAAFATVKSDYIAFTYVEYRATLQSMVDLMGQGGSLDSTTVDEELLLMVPAWIASSARFENDAIVGDGGFPSIDIGFKASNKRSTLTGHVPPKTIFYAETHDVGKSLTAVLDRFRALPDLREAFAQIDQAAAVAGGINGTIGWWGDTAFAISTGSDGSVGGGLLIAPTDVNAAKTSFGTLRTLLAIGGGQAGLEVRDVQHGDTTVTIIDFSGVSGMSDVQVFGSAPTELSYAVTNDVVVIGYGTSFVTDVLDAGPGPSLADDARFKGLLGRVGDENVGLTFVDVDAIRRLVEPLVRESAPADAWASYEREVVPYVSHLDAVISSIRIDGDIDRLISAFTVK